MPQKKYVRGCLVGFDILLMIAAGVSLGLGIFVLRKQYGISEIGQVTENNLLEIALYLLFAGSAFATVIGFCGCCGACCDNKCLIACHCVLLFCTVLVLVSSLCLGFFFRFWLGCCGVFGHVNSTTSWAIYKLESHWYKRYTTGRPYIPITCCRRGADANLCTGIRSFRGPPKHGPPIQDGMMSNPHMHSIGCYDKLAQFLENNTLVLVCFSLATVFIIIVGMFLSACLCRMLDRNNRRYATPRR